MGESSPMTTIKIDNLKPAGAELFCDSETFIDDLSNDELAYIHGGSKSGNRSLFLCFIFAKKDKD
jgi:hypothetical protein